MAVTVTHATQSAAPDSGDGKISSNAWNESHSISGLGTAAEADATDFAAATHNHVIANVTGLQAALDGKQASGSYLTSITSGDITAALGYTPTSVTGLTGVQSVAALKAGLSLVKGDVGLGNVDNTSDANKPVSTATQTALNLKADTLSLGYFATGTDAANLTGTVAAVRLPALSGGDVTSSAGSAVLTIGNGAVSLAKMANVATGTVFYRKTAGSGTPEVQTLATLKTDLGLTGTNSGDQTITLSGDVSGSGTGAITATIGANKVTRSMLAATGGARLLGATAAGNVADLTGTQATTLLDTFTSALKGLAPASGGGTTNFLRADGTWAVPPGSGGGVADADYGDIVVSSGATVWTIDTSIGKAWTGAHNFAGGLTTTGGTISRFENTGGSVPAGAAGAGLELSVAGSTTPTFLAYNRTTDAYAPMAISASTIDVRTAGSSMATLDSNGINLASGYKYRTNGVEMAPLANPQFTGVSFYQQPTPTALTASATLTIAQLLTLVITVTKTTAVSLTLPTGTLTDAGILSGALAVDEAFEWYVINLGTSSGAVTILAGTGHTIVGNATVAISTSARFLTRKTATNTFITYRIA